MEDPEIANYKQDDQTEMNNKKIDFKHSSTF